MCHTGRQTLCFADIGILKLKNVIHYGEVKVLRLARKPERNIQTLNTVEFCNIKIEKATDRIAALYSTQTRNEWCRSVWASYIFSWLQCGPVLIIITNNQKQWTSYQANLCVLQCNTSLWVNICKHKKCTHTEPQTNIHTQLQEYCEINQISINGWVRCVRSKI